jgi:hypothetical protein
VPDFHGFSDSQSGKGNSGNGKGEILKEWKLRLGSLAIPISLLVAGLLAAPVLLVDILLLPVALHSLRSNMNSGDSWNPMRTAYAWYASPHQGTLYQAVFFDQHIKFQYRPSSLLLFKVADLLHFSLTNRLLNSATFLMYCLEAAAMGYLAYATLDRTCGARGRILPVCGAALAALLTLDFSPVVVSQSQGQIQTLLNTAFVLACLCWFKDRRFLAGLLIGVICLFKPQFALFLLWGALRRQGSFLLGWAVIVVPAEVLSLAVFGLANHLDYLAALSFMSRRGEVFYSNQSINGLLNRFLGTGDSLVFDRHGFPPFQPVVYIGTMISSLLLIGGSLLYRMRSPSTNVFDLMIAGLTFTLASPIAWIHHYGILPVTILFAAVTIPRVASPAARVALSAGLVLAATLASHYSPFYDRSYPGLKSLTESTIFFGCLGILGLLYWLRDTFAQIVELRPVDSHSKTVASREQVLILDS